MNINISSFISLVIIGSGITHSNIPEEYSKKTIRKIDETNISEFMSSVMNAQKTGNILVITKIEAVAQLVRAINLNLKNNRISVMCNDQLDTSALEDEIKERSLHTADGRILVPEIIRNYPSLMHAGSQIIIKRKPVDNEEAVFNADNETAGVLLNNSFKYENIIGTVSENINLLTNAEKASLMLEMVKNKISDTVYFSDIILIRTENEYSFVILPSENTQSICEAELQLFTGLTRKNNFCEIIEKLAGFSLPDVLFEDISRIITNFYITHNTPLPTNGLIKNTMERILLTEELS